MSARRGIAAHPLYMTWTAMRQRCSNPKTVNYHLYGGRGIRVCARWLTFSAFLEDMGPRPSAAHSMERMDNGRGYEPGNVVWATRKQQRAVSPERHHVGCNRLSAGRAE
jgi:hypothetical protein